MAKTVSTKCGKITCDYYSKHSLSRCKIHDDRKKCSLSMQQRRKQKHKSKQRPPEI